MNTVEPYHGAASYSSPQVTPRQSPSAGHRYNEAEEDLKTKSYDRKKIVRLRTALPKTPSLEDAEEGRCTTCCDGVHKRFKWVDRLRKLECLQSLRCCCSVHCCRCNDLKEEPSPMPDVAHYSDYRKLRDDTLSMLSMIQKDFRENRNNDKLELRIKKLLEEAIDRKSGKRNKSDAQTNAKHLSNDYDVCKEARVDIMGSLLQAVCEQEEFDEEVVKLLLKNEADVNHRDIRGLRPLHSASISGNLKMVMLLCKEKVQLTARTLSGKTPLQYAANAKLDRAEICKIIIESMKANKSIEESELFEDIKDALFLAVEKGHKKTTKVCLNEIELLPKSSKNEKGIVIWKYRQYISPLHVAAASNHSGIIQLLLKQGANSRTRTSVTKNPRTEKGGQERSNKKRKSKTEKGGKSDKTESQSTNETDDKEYGQIPLHFAACNEAVDACQVLLKHDPDSVNAIDNQGWTPLHAAAEFGNFDAAVQLLECGAPVNHGDKYGLTPLHLAATSGNVRMIKLLKSHGASTAAKTNIGRTPLHFAASKNAVKACEELIGSNGQSIEIPDMAMRTPLFAAVEFGSYEAAELLLKKHQDRTEDKGANNKDKCGITPLHVAASTNNTAMIELLCRYEAEIEARTEVGQTPLHFAACYDAVQACDILLNKMIEENKNNRARLNTATRTPAHLAVGVEQKAKTTLDELKFSKFIEYDADEDIRKEIIDVEDETKRTPLFSAIELDCRNTARWLVENRADVTKRDASGRPCLTMMAKHMKDVAKIALDRYRSEMFRDNDDYSFHAFSELFVPNKNEPTVKTLLQVIVDHQQLDIISHPLINKYLSLEWNRFARFRAWGDLMVYFIYIFLWTLLGIGHSWQIRYRYILPDPDSWRISFWIVNIVASVIFMSSEIKEILNSRNNFRKWKKKRSYDIAAEKQLYKENFRPIYDALKKEEGELDKNRSSYRRDFWNIFDWILIVFNFILLATHLFEVFFYDSENRPPPCCGKTGCDETAELIRKGNLTDLDACASLGVKVNNLSLSVWVTRIFTFNVIMMWFGLLKYMRTFKNLGPLIISMRNVMADVRWFLVLFIIFYTAYVFGFWIVFGLHTPIASISSVDQIMFSLYRITLVDEYQYDQMHEFDIVMTYFLVGTFLAISALLCVNVLIALLTDAFQRVRDKSTAYSKMQQANFIMRLEESLTDDERKEHKTIIRDKWRVMASSDQEDEEDNSKKMEKVLQKIESMEEKLNKSLSKLSDTSLYAGPTDTDKKSWTKSRQMTSPDLEYGGT